MSSLSSNAAQASRNHHQTTATTNSTQRQTTTTTTSHRPQQQQQLAWGRYRFRFNMDTLFDILNCIFEVGVYLLGPVLICLAFAIMTGLAYTFFWIMVPMLRQYYNQSSFSPFLANAILYSHIIWTCLLLYNALFNYTACVMTSNKGRKYDRVVRELARATEFRYPETDIELEQFRRDYEDKLILRMRRQRAAAQQQQQTTTTTTTTMTQRRHPINNATAASNASGTTAAASPLPLRRWMIMGPYEWGYCIHTNQAKPPRSHYDHVTKTLVLCLDHYCPWMFNSIGYFNYRYFFNFLVTVGIGMTYGAIITFAPFRAAQTPAYRQQMQMMRLSESTTRMFPMVPFKSEKMAITLSFMLCISVGVAVLLLGGFHTYLILTGQTTIEFHGNMAKRRQMAKRGGKYKNPYDVGMKRNWQQVFGPGNPFVAMLPSLREPCFLPVPLTNARRRNEGQNEAAATNAAKNEVV